jgi:hypothetical protein
MKNLMTIFILISLIGLVSCKKEKQMIERIYDNPAYSIGEIKSYRSGTFKVTYNYDFTVNGSEYTGKEIARGIGQLDEKLIGRSYLVVYNKDDITESDLNFNYLIESQQQFDSLIIVFQTTPPNP